MAVANPTEYLIAYQFTFFPRRNISFKIYVYRCAFSSVQDGIYALGKAHMRSTPSFRSFPNVPFETVPMFVWLKLFKLFLKAEGRRALPLSTPLSSRRSKVWCHWLCTRRWCLKLRNTSDLPRSKPLVRFALPASLSAWSFPFTPAYA